MISGKKNLILALVVGFIVAGLGALECRYGRYDYTGDSIAYLDVAQAIRHGDGVLAFSPYWSIAYPFLLAVTRWMFPAGPQGEWISVHVLNFAIFLGTYLAFLYFLKVVTGYAARVNGGEVDDAQRPFFFVIGSFLFMLWELIAENMSRISPDLLVSLVFFLVTGTSLRFCLRPRVQTAIALGLLMGLGYLAKAIFLPISACVLATLFLYAITRSRADRVPAVARLLWALPALVLIAAPYVAAVSQNTGRFTLGESGRLNHAWNVNGLLGFEHWQGGPPEFGAPIHPTQLALKNPPVFVFAEPFHVTYPPWFNPFYWYEGYHDFFNLHNQLVAIKVNFLRLSQFFFDTPHSPIKSIAALVLLAAATLLLKDRALFWQRLGALWPVYLPSLAGIVIYLLVFIEVRYIVGFIIVLVLTPFLVLFLPTPLMKKWPVYAALALVVVICIPCREANKQSTPYQILAHESFSNTDQWRMGLYLAGAVTHPGEKVASVQAANHANHAGRTWARASEVHIVAEIGNDAYDREDQAKDFALFTGSPEVQQTVFALFRQAGADLVVVRDVPGPISGEGWQPIPGTSSWYHRL